MPPSICDRRQGIDTAPAGRAPMGDAGMGTGAAAPHGVEPEADRVGRIEVRGIEVIPDSDRHGHPRELFFVWGTANLTVLYLIFGGILISLGLELWQAILAAVVGNLFYAWIGVAAT